MCRDIGGTRRRAPPATAGDGPAANAGPVHQMSSGIIMIAPHGHSVAHMPQPLQ